MAEQQMTEEQAKEMQEKLKNMSPEELKEFQKQQCIFCHIVEGKVASRKIYEDDKVLAILDINPANPGHILLMPKEHYAIMPMIPKEEMDHLIMVSKALSHIVLNSLKAEGTNIFIANGVAAGQRAQHFMIHIIPRKEGDGLPFDIPENKFSVQQISSIAKQIKDKLGGDKKERVEVPEIEPEEIKDAEFKEIEPEIKKKVVKKKVVKKKAMKKKAKKVSKKKSSKKENEKVSLDEIAGLFK